MSFFAYFSHFVVWNFFFYAHYFVVLQLEKFLRKENQGVEAGKTMSIGKLQVIHM
jgi:hypothetical protein